MEMAVDNRISLKEALYETLNEILSPQVLVRNGAEEKIKALEVTEEYGIYLAQFTIDNSIHLAIRQLAIVLLKRYVENHWNNLATGYQDPQIPSHCKIIIKEIIPSALNEPVSKIRSTAAYTVAAIAHWDWPDNWPQLFDLLVNNLTGGNYSTIHGTMKVLKEIAEDLSDSQLPQIAPVILSHMFRIFSEDQKYDASIRECAIEIFSSCAFMICAVSEYHKNIIKTLFTPVLPSFCDRFIIELEKPTSFPEDISLKTQIIKALTLIIKRSPKSLAPFIIQILSRIWQTLILNAHIYINSVVNNPDDLDDCSETTMDILKTENLVFSILEFFDSTLNCQRFQPIIREAITELLYYCILFMQISEKQIVQWTNDLGMFIDSDEEAPFTYSVRVAAQDFFTLLCGEFPTECCRAIEEAITKHVGESHQAKALKNPHWWKILEACVYALGSIKSIILDDELPVKVDILGFIHKIVVPELRIEGPDLLFGRCIWFGSKFASKLEPIMIEPFLQATISGLQLERPCVRACAIRAIYGFCFHLKNRKNTNLIIPLLPIIMENLITLVVQAPPEILFTVLETITIAISIEDKFSELYSSKVISIAIAIFLKHNSDPQLMIVIQELFKQLCQNEKTLELVQQRLVPTLVSIFNAPCDKIPTGMHPVALDILQTLVRYSRSPLSTLLVDNAFPAAIHCIMNTDDNSVMQSGGEVLRRYLAAAPDQVCTYQDNSGRTGLSYILQVISQLLNPISSENTATFIGRLIITLIKKAGNYLGEHLDLLLKAVLSKMQRAEALVVIQSLLMVYVHLILTQLDGVLRFLSSIPGPTGESALHFVLIEWVSKQHLFYGSYERKTSIAALCKLLEYGISSNDVILNTMTVRGEQIFDDNAGVKTRSQQRTFEWTTIPFLVKVYKLIVSECAYVMESELADEQNNLEDSEDELEWRDPTVNISNTAFYDVESITDDDDDDDDGDLKEDPYYHMNLKEYLKEFLKSFSQQPCFRMFYTHMNPLERKVISSIGINTNF